MQKIFTWINQHKLVSVLLLVIVWLLWRGWSGRPVFGSLPLFQDKRAPYERGAVFSSPGSFNLDRSGIISEPAPQPDAQKRLVVKHSRLSLLVKDVSASIKSIQHKVEALGGYMVEAEVRNPSEAATGSITVRVPVTRLDEALDYFRELSVKVVSENLSGRDVTDQYIDIQSRLEAYYKVKERFERILEQATEVDDLLRVHREIINIQTQIDSLLGQQQLLEKTAQNSKVTIYLSTDELALPYTPDQPWRPRSIVKRAVRSLILTYRSLGTLLIWVGVYAGVWLPIAALFLLVRWAWRRYRRGN